MRQFGSGGWGVGGGGVGRGGGGRGWWGVFFFESSRFPTSGQPLNIFIADAEIVEG